MENRKLAAIMAADLVGYSRLAGEDEERTLIRLRSLRSEFLDPTIAIHNGRVVKRIGDGLLVEFRSVVDATRCALEIQRGVGDRNAGIGKERRFLFRIGIHVGDVVEEADGDLMGDGVNIAARLEGIAKPGAVCLSEDAYRQVRNRLSLSIDDLGMNKLKNISDPMRVFSIGVDVEPSRTKSASRPVGWLAAGVAVVAAAVGAAYFAGGAFLLNKPQIAAPPVAPPTAAAPRLAEAKAMLDAGRNEDAFAAYTEIAMQGDAEAQFQLGRLYRDGRGAPADSALAAQWFRKAADQGNAWSQAVLGDLYWRGQGVTRDYAQALRWFQAAASKGNPLGQNGLGILYQNGWGVPRDEEQALRWYRKAADQEFGWGYANLGVMYRRGLGVPADYVEARRWFQKAADRGNAGGQNGLGTLYLFGQGVERDREKAFEWFLKAAKQGHDWGEFNAAEILRSDPAHRDYSEARRLLTHAASQGHAGAMSLLGVMHENGEGGPADFRQAFDWYSRAADLGFGWGLMNLGYLYAHGLGVERDCDRAKSWFNKALDSELGHEVREWIAVHPVCDYVPELH